MKKNDTMKIIRWVIGAVLLGGLISIVIFRPFSCLFAEQLPYSGFVCRALFIILVACVLCMIRVALGPTGADRIVAIDILGIMIIGLCALLTISTGRLWYIDIGIAWGLQSFISTLALCKYLEGREFDA